MTRHAAPAPRNRLSRGSVLVVVTLFLPVLIGFMVASVDVGFFYAQKSQLQAVADLACMTALGNVTWVGTSAADQEAEMIQLFRQTLQQNGHDPDTFGTPEFPAPRNNNHERIQVAASVPVRTFFWDFIRPNDSQMTIHVRSAAEVVYDISWEPIGGNWGMYAFDSELDPDKPGFNAGGNFSAEAYSRSFAANQFWDPATGSPPVDSGDPNRYLDMGTAGSAGVGGSVSVVGNFYAHDVLALSGSAEITVDSLNPHLYDDRTGYLYADIIDGTDSNLNVDQNKVMDGHPGPILEVDVPPPPSESGEDNHNHLIRFYKWDNHDGWVHDPDGSLTADGGLDVRNHRKVVFPGGGNYEFTTFDMAANAHIEVDWSPDVVVDADAMTRIFHTGDDDFHINGQFESYHSTQIITQTTGEFHFNGGALFYADIWAPDAHVRYNGNADFYGRVLADTLDVRGTATFYFDTDLPAWGGQQSTLPQVVIPVHLVIH